MIEQAGLDMLGIALNVLSGAMIMAGAFIFSSLDTLTKR